MRYRRWQETCGSAGYDLASDCIPTVPTQFRSLALILALPHLPPIGRSTTRSLPGTRTPSCSTRLNRLLPSSTVQSATSSTRSATGALTEPCRGLRMALRMGLSRPDTPDTRSGVVPWNRGLGKRSYGSSRDGYFPPQTSARWNLGCLWNGRFERQQPTSP